MAEYTAEQVEAMAADLRDAPGTSMLGTHISVSTSKAVAMYEVLTAYAATLHQQGDQAGGVVSEEVEQIAWRAFRRSAGEMLDGSCFADKGDIRAAIEAVAPLLRAPAEQGGRVDEAMVERAAAGLYAHLRPDAQVAWGDLNDYEADKIRDEATAAIEAALAQIAQGEAVAEVDAGEDGLFVEILYGPDGSPLKIGDKLYLHAERVRVPEPIIELAECRKVGWNDSAPAYRAGWNARRDAMLAAAPSQPEDAGHE